RPEVLAHNVETVPRIFRRIRPGFRYERSLKVITMAREAGLVTKSNLILGMGEKPEEVRPALQDLYDAGCDIITITQYLRPSPRHHPVDRWVKPEEFVEHTKAAEEIGFPGVMAGPLVRSSYRAGRLYAKATLHRGLPLPANLKHLAEAGTAAQEASSLLKRPGRNRTDLPRVCTEQRAGPYPEGHGQAGQSRQESGCQGTAPEQPGPRQADHRCVPDAAPGGQAPPPADDRGLSRRNRRGVPAGHDLGPALGVPPGRPGVRAARSGDRLRSPDPGDRVPQGGRAARRSRMGAGEPARAVGAHPGRGRHQPARRGAPAHRPPRHRAGR